MSKRIVRIAAATLLAHALFGAAAVEAQYRYGKSRYGRYGGSGEQGFLLLLDVVLASPRDTDNVAATDIVGSTVLPILPVWGEDPAGRIGLGYAWAGGSALTVTYWTHEADTSESGAASPGGFLAFAIGPPTATGGDVGSPGFFDIATEITAETADVAFSRTHELSETFSMTWSAGLRWASFEEVQSGTYDEAATNAGVNSFRAFKGNSGDMIGARLAVRGTYRIGRFSLGAGLGLSALDGELEALSTLVPSGTGNGGTGRSLAAVTDDGRSGTIRELDLEAALHLAGEAVRIAVGWEQAEWEDIAADLVRNFPGTVAPLADRDSVVFSGVRVGLRLRF